MKKHDARCIKNLLLRYGLKVAVAESCTGGEVSSALTSIPGSSLYFTLGVIAYHTSMKIKVLKIPDEVINKFTVYSPETAFEMAKMVKNLAESDVGISTTGEFNGKGYFYMCIYMSDERYVIKKFHTYGDRIPSKERATSIVLNELIKFLISRP